MGNLERELHALCIFLAGITSSDTPIRQAVAEHTRLRITKAAFYFRPVIGSRSRPRVRARGQSSVFPHFAHLPDARAAIPRGAIPGTCTGERTRARACAWAILSVPPFCPPPGRTCGNTPRGKSLERVPGSARARVRAGSDLLGDYPCDPRPTSTDWELLVSNEISTRVDID